MGGGQLADLSWPHVPEGAIVLVPVGSLEQHGPHLPFDTDTRIASAAAARAAYLLVASGHAVVVAPALPVGASGEHQAFPGTVSIGHDALRVVLVELTRSFSTWAGRIVLVNGHGGNVPTLRDALAQMRIEGHDVSWFPCAFESSIDAHAGADETSVMLHLDPARVAMDRAAPGRTEPLPQLLPDLMAHGVRPVSPNGVLGDPTSADAVRGEVLLAGLVERLVRAVVDGKAQADGLLTVAAAGAGDDD